MQCQYVRFSERVSELEPVLPQGPRPVIEFNILSKFNAVEVSRVGRHDRKTIACSLEPRMLMAVRLFAVLQAYPFMSEAAARVPREHRSHWRNRTLN